MHFLQPSYLYGFFALAIPIAIHLWSRKKVLTIKIGSILFIPETKSKQSNSIQLNEWLLLALRCLIISTLVLILAEPQLTKKGKQQDVAYIFEPSLLMTQEGIDRFEQIPLEGRRLLDAGFPEWEQDDELTVSEQPPNYWQLAQQMNQIPADSIVVFTNAFAKALKGKRPTVSTKINWIPVGLELSVNEPLFAKVLKDSIEVTSAQTDERTLSIERTLLSKESVAYNAARDSVSIATNEGKRQLPIVSQKPLNIAIVYDLPYAMEKSYFEAAFRAIATYTDQEIILDVQKYGEDTSLVEMDRLVWLSDFEMGGIEIPTLALEVDEFADRLIVSSKIQNKSFFRKELTPDILEKEQFVGQLLEWLELGKAIEGKMQEFDMRVVSESQLETNYKEKNSNKARIQVADLSNLLWIVFIVLLLGERLVAKLRKQ